LRTAAWIALISRSGGKFGGIRAEGTMDIAAWLHGLGLDRYEAAFRENHIDEALLGTLTDEDLRELGVASLGPWCKNSCEGCRDGRRVGIEAAH
jgi:hypothetical protein